MKEIISFHGNYNRKKYLFVVEDGKITECEDAPKWKDMRKNNLLEALAISGYKGSIRCYKVINTVTK